MDDRKRIMLLDLGSSTTTTGCGRRVPTAERSKARADREVCMPILRPSHVVFPPTAHTQRTRPDKSASCVNRLCRRHRGPSGECRIPGMRKEGPRVARACGSTSCKLLPSRHRCYAERVGRDQKARLGVKVAISCRGEELSHGLSGEDDGDGQRRTAFAER
jgi:hypothetical protein